MKAFVLTGFAAVLALAAAVGVRAQGTPTFKSQADAVTVGVSVRRGGRPVSDLALADFELRDNGVVQQISGLSFEKLPIDVTVLLDISGSVSGAVLDQLRRAVSEVQHDLLPVDRLRIVAFNMRIQRVLEADATTPIEPAFASINAGGSSAILDALAVALASPAPPDRRQFVVLFSDGKDTISVNTPAALLDTASHTTPTVSVVLATPVRRPADRIYTDLASETGGSVISLLPDETLGATMRRALAQFRSSYVLTFSPSGVPRVGAHALEVRVARAGVEVRARRGYVLR